MAAVLLKREEFNNEVEYNSILIQWQDTRVQRQRFPGGSTNPSWVKAKLSRRRTILPDNTARPRSASNQNTLCSWQRNKRPSTSMAFWSVSLLTLSTRPHARKA